MTRTRGQLAVPVTFGLKIRSWLEPLERQEQRLKEISPRLFKIQLGGAAGDLAAFKNNSRELVYEVATILKLLSAPSWHSQRDTLAEVTNWLATLTGVTGKMGADILVMSQDEVGEITESVDGGGKSSAMPHKNNPVLSEALVAMARMNATLQSQQLQSMVHVSERDATAWILEWNTIPQMLAFTAASLNHAISICAGMKVHTDAMEKNVTAFLSKNEK
jgi:3-carboxy-cis,cis-muconate cycloisomerase